MAGHLVAAAYAAMGWSVLPITPLQKFPPLLKSWLPYQSQIATLNEIKEWWNHSPSANLAIVTGVVSDLSVIDVDDDAGGLASLKGADIRFPRTRVHKTPHGYHLLFRYNPALHTGAGFLPGIDCRSDGGYIVAPPSQTEAGVYTVFRDAPLATLEAIPEALTAHTRPVAPRERRDNPTVPRDPDWVASALLGAPLHQRNDEATRLTGYFHRKGLSRAVILQVMSQFAARCNPPMELHELERTIDSVLRLSGGVIHQQVEGLWNHRT